MKHRSLKKKRKCLNRAKVKLRRRRSSSCLCNIGKRKHNLRRDKRSRKKYNHLRVIGFRCAKKKHHPPGDIGHGDHKESDNYRGPERIHDHHENQHKTDSPGPQGSRGPQGPEGAQGLQGIPGIPGQQGPQGIQGAQGQPGMPGAQGPTGAAGIEGLPGTQGSQGIPGVPGVPGQQGPQGNTGAQGLPGIPGLQGASGPTGATGITGPPGEQGIRGSTGVTGPPGTGITGGVEVKVLPTVYRYFYFPSEDVQSTVSIPSNQFTDDHGNVVTVFDGIGTNCYSNVFINGILQEGSLYAISTTDLTLFLGGSVVYATVPITVENVEFNTQVIYI